MTPSTPYRRTLSKDARQALLSKGRASTPAVTPMSAHAAECSEYGPPPGFAVLADLKQTETLEFASQTLGVANPYFRLHEGHAKTTTVIDGAECLNFASYDYLGLNADPRPGDAARAAIAQYGVSASASRMVAGDRPVHRALEAGLARHYGVADALVFVSGHATNVSMIGALMGQKDLILHDAYIHNSAAMGIQLSGAARRSFPHNDLKALEDILKQNRARHERVLVVVEGLYSMDGDLCDLPGLIALRKRYGFWLMVDEAHALGTLGETGRGSAEHFGINPEDVDIWMGTLSKTLASTGGYVAGSTDLIKFLRHHASGFVYSVALPPALAASALKALELAEMETERAAALRANGAAFERIADGLGLDTGLSEGSAVMPIMVGDSALAAKLSERLLDAGVNVAPVTFPGVPMNAARLRFFLTASHTEAQIEEALRLTRRELDRLNDEGFTDMVAQAVSNFVANAS